MKEKPAAAEPIEQPVAKPVEAAPAAAPAGPPRRSSAPFLLGLAGGLIFSLLLAVPPFLRSMASRFGIESPPLFPPVFPGPAALLPLLLIAAGVWLLLWAVPHFRGPDPALHLLRERYARGEISEGEYRRMAETLHVG